MLTNIFLQITTEELPVGQEQSADSLSLLDMVFKGGWFMIPLLVLSVLAVYLITERLLTLKKADMDPTDFINKIKETVAKGDINGAQMLCAQHDKPISRMIGKGLKRIGTPLKNIEASIENAGKIEIYNLEKNLSILATISGAAPMIGFLGTVTGMVSAFIAISQEEGSVSPKLLSSGIYEAMITTVAGLIVGIIAYVGYNYLSAKVEKIVHRMEYSVIEFVEMLQDPR